MQRHHVHRSGHNTARTSLHPKRFKEHATPNNIPFPRHPSLSTPEKIRVRCGQPDNQTRSRDALSPTVEAGSTESFGELEDLFRSSLAFRTVNLSAPALTTGAVEYTDGIQVPKLQDG